MLTIKCPQCSTALKLRQAPPSGKVKCPKCAGVVPVKAAAAGKPAGKPAGQPKRAAAPVDPDDDAFDFGRINFPSASGANAVSAFPVSGNADVYEGPIPGDPLAGLEADNAAAAEAAAAEAGEPYVAQAAPAKKKNPKVLIGALAGLGIVLIAGVAGIAMMSGGGGGGAANEDVLAAAKASAPDGYKAFGIEGVVVLMPKGSEMDPKSLPSMIECAATESAASGSTFFMGAMDGGTRPLDGDQMRKKAGRQLGGEILGGTDMTRNGYPGIKGMLDGSLFLPRMQVEAFHVDGRFVILGCAPLSMGADPSVQMQVDRGLEAAEQEIFYGSFKVGAKPSGFFGF
ncbi:MAG: hypothetical protein AB8B91_02375 [Rubripirellula sp.]